MILRIVSSVLIFSIFLSPSLFSQDFPWISLEKGKASFASNQRSLALESFLNAVELNPEYPEAEYWLARVYQSQGQAVLAEEQYRRAIQLAPYLRVPEDRLVFQYALAGLLRDQGVVQRQEAEALLLLIADKEGASFPAEIELEYKYILRLSEDGPDELLYLYRDELGSSLRARRELAEIAWEDARYRSALLHSTRVVLSLFSTASERIRYGDPTWRFDIDDEKDDLAPDRDVRYPGLSDGMNKVLDRSLQDKKLAMWLEQEGLWSASYLLASALYAEGHAVSAQSVWRILVVEQSLGQSIKGREEAGIWGNLAVSQLEEPFISVGSITP